MNTKEEGLGVEMLDLLVDHVQGRRRAAETPVEEPRHRGLMRSFMVAAVEAIGLLLVISLAERLRSGPRGEREGVAAIPHFRHRSDEHRRQGS